MSSSERASSSSKAAAGSKGAAKVTIKKEETTSEKPASEVSTFWWMIRLGRPKFLMYSLAMHLIGTFLAAQQKQIRGNKWHLFDVADWQMFGLIQLTIWATHIMTHYFNEYGDYEVDMLNKNAGTWTGGSKVLGTGKVSRRAALVAGILCLIVAFAAGATTVLRYTVSILRMDPYTIVHDPMRVLRVLPWDFIGLGLSVFVVAIAYSIEPFKLSSHALGELCVSYVLTLVTPVVGLLGQGGRISLDILTVLIPLFIINANRMVVMNIPDRAGDEEGGKVTSVVLLGEERSVTLHNVITLATYLSVIPALPLPLHIKIAYYSVLPLRWWQSLRLNVPKWWTQRYYTDSIPFVESMYVLSTGVALCVGLFFRVSFV